MHVGALLVTALLFVTVCSSPTPLPSWSCNVGTIIESVCPLQRGAFAILFGVANDNNDPILVEVALPATAAAPSGQSCAVTQVLPLPASTPFCSTYCSQATLTDRGLLAMAVWSAASDTLLRAATFHSGVDGGLSAWHTFARVDTANTEPLLVSLAGDTVVVMWLSPSNALSWAIATATMGGADVASLPVNVVGGANCANIVDVVSYPASGAVAVYCGTSAGGVNAVMVFPTGGSPIITSASPVAFATAWGPGQLLLIESSSGDVFIESPFSPSIGAEMIFALPQSSGWAKVAPSSAFGILSIDSAMGVHFTFLPASGNDFTAVATPSSIMRGVTTTVSLTQVNGVPLGGLVALIAADAGCSQQVSTARVVLSAGTTAAQFTVDVRHGIASLHSHAFVCVAPVPCTAASTASGSLCSVVETRDSCCFDGNGAFVIADAAATGASVMMPPQLRSVSRISVQATHTRTASIVPLTTAPPPAPTTTTAPTTHAPTTVAPTTGAPTTHAPTTHAPTTVAPTTHAPTTTNAPMTVAPTTHAPTSVAPTTNAPTTVAPTTHAPTTAAPTTHAPTTVAPTTNAPTTVAPTTHAPTTHAPTTTNAPTTVAPTTHAQTTVAPTTNAPRTQRPTKAPLTTEAHTPAATRSASLPVAAISGGAVAGVLVLVAILVCVALKCRALRHESSKRPRLDNGSLALLQEDDGLQASGVNSADVPVGEADHADDVLGGGPVVSSTGGSDLPVEEEVVHMFDNERYTIRRVIGRGGYGTVYAATSVSSSELVALKFIPCETPDDFLATLDELQAVMGLEDNPYIVPVHNIVFRGATRDSCGDARSAERNRKAKLKEVHQGDGLFNLNRMAVVITPYYPEGDLRCYVNSFVYAGKPFPQRKAALFASQLCNAIAFAHTKNIVHRDIKPENLLLSHNYECIVLTDFGLCKLLDNIQQTLHTKAGSLPYIAPECFRGRYDNRVDHWAIGCVMYAIATMRVDAHNTRHMYREANRPDFCDSIRDDLRHYDPEYAEILLTLLTVDPKGRATLQDTEKRLQELLARLQRSPRHFLSPRGAAAV